MQRQTHLGDMPIEVFLSDYWQQKPLLIRNAFPDLHTLLSADELAGLALEEDVVSRLVIEHCDKTPSDWTVRHGPFDESTFTSLPLSHWSLLVQHVDSLEPQINALLHRFRFIPNWRLDDIMISYASPGGGVGPHFDYYDVFLIQAQGRRRWRLGQWCDSQSILVDNQPMKILQDFATSEDWVVNAGDLLYVPAKLAHWGEAIDECLTYSVGFRAPSHSDFLLDYTQEFVTQLDEDQRYEDARLAAQIHPGQIQTEVIDYFAKLLNKLKNPETLARWFGEYSTQLKQDIRPCLKEISDAELNNAVLSLNPFCRVAYYVLDDYALCFINGNTWRCSIAFAQILSNYQLFTFSELIEQDQAIVLELHQQQLLHRVS